MEKMGELNGCKVVCRKMRVINRPPVLKLFKRMHVKAKVAEEEPLEQVDTVDYTYKQPTSIPYTPRAPLERLLRHNIPETSDTRIVVHLHPS